MQDNPTLTSEHIERIRSVAQLRSVRTGEVLYEPSCPDVPLFVVLDGIVSISRTGEDEKILAVREPGQFTGEMSVISGSRSLLTARVTKDGAVLELTREKVLSLGHAYRVQNSRTTVSSQLREGPVVLIGALNNDWTLNRTSSLRFHLEGPDGPDRIYWIADTQHPESRAWQVRAQAPRSQVVKDYAIAARFTDESTGQVVLVAAGIAGSGTRAAGEFLTDEADLKQLAAGAGVDWARTNFEVVLSSQVVNGMQGKPKVEAEAFW